MTTKNDYRDAIAAAESLVRSELRLAKLKSLNAPVGCLSTEREVVGDRMSNIVLNELALKLLPQARNILSMREKRLEFLMHRTFLGQCHDKVDDLFVEFAHSCEETDEEYETRQEALDVLAKALRTGDGSNACAVLVNIFEFIANDLLFRTEELPPLPPPYKLPGTMR